MPVEEIKATLDEVGVVVADANPDLFARYQRALGALDALMGASAPAAPAEAPSGEMTQS
jgi:hypothetical protein